MSAATFLNKRKSVKIGRGRAAVITVSFPNNHCKAICGKVGNLGFVQIRSFSQKTCVDKGILVRLPANWKR